MRHSPGFLDLVERKRPHVSEISVDALAGRLPPVGFYLIDVREESEWQAGRIANARHIGKGVIERDIEAAIPDRDAEIILYCGGGYRSVLAASALMEMGYRKVRSLQGGYRAWTERRFPIEVP